MTLWKVNCMEDTYPGMWPRWFRSQSVAIGWPPGDGWCLDGTGNQAKGWTTARDVVRRVTVGDSVIVQLRHHRVGRLGQVPAKSVGDHEWQPFVRPSQQLLHGEMGRRIDVRWDLTIGPDDRDMVVLLPPDCRFRTDEVRQTIAEITSIGVDQLVAAMRDPGNWVGLLTHFTYERSLSEYIAAYPHLLEDGLLPYPEMHVREQVFNDRSRSDVLLVDRNDRPVVVECKQWSPTPGDVGQLQGYMHLLKEAVGTSARGFLVHGGARMLSTEVRMAIGNDPIEVVQYKLGVDFSPCQ